MSSDFETITADLASIGFTPGVLLKLKAKKIFWKETEEMYVEKLFVEKTKSWKEVLSATEHQVVPTNGILLFLGYVTKDTLVRTFVEDNGIETLSNAQHRVLSFLYDKMLLWWDYHAITEGTRKLSEIFEVVGDQEAEK